MSTDLYRERITIWHTINKVKKKNKFIDEPYSRLL